MKTKKCILLAAMAAFGVWAFRGAALGITIGTFGVATLAQGGSQGCGSSAQYDTTDGGSLGSSTTPSNSSIMDCATTALKGTTTKGAKSAFGQTAQQALTSGGTPISSSDLSSASLASGNLHSMAQTSAYGAITDQSLWDMLTFKIRGATASTLTKITLNFAVTGTYGDVIDPGDFPDGASLVQAELQVGNTTPCDCTHGNDVQWGINRSDINNMGPGFFVEDSSFVTWNVSSSSNSGVAGRGTITLQGAHPTLGILTRLNLVPDVDANTNSLKYDYNVSLTLPAGVTFTSASRVFLTRKPRPRPAKRPTASPT